MKAPVNNDTAPRFDVKSPGVTSDCYLEIEPQGEKQFPWLPVHIKELTAEGVVLELVDLPAEIKAEGLVNQSGTIHLAPDGLSKESQLRTKVAWFRQGELGESHYLFGFDLKEADFQFRRSLKNLLARPKDISDLWKYWDQATPKPATDNGKIIFYLGAAAFLGGVALHFALPDSRNPMAIILILAGSLMIAGKCLWHWWRERSLTRG